MSFRILLLVATLFSTICFSDEVEVDPIAADPIEADPDSELNFYIPGFLPWTDATIGVAGVETSTQFGGDVLLKNLDMIGLAGLEGRKGKWGFILEGMYLDLGVSGETQGRLLSSIDIGFEQLIAEGTVTYRIHETDKMFVELLVGARYYWVGSELGLNVNPSGSKAVSKDISKAIVNRTASAVKSELDRRLAAALAGLPLPGSNLKPGAVNRFDGKVQKDVDTARAAIGQTIRSELGARGASIGEGIGDNDQIRNLVRRYARAKLEARIEERRAQGSAAVAAARKAVRNKAQRALNKAEKNLAQGIEKAINQRLPTETLADSKGWVDPFIGLRGKVMISEDIYFIARADYGGFGVSSESAYNIYGALGTQLKENTTLEVGIRHMGVDYRRGGFTYDGSFTGPFSGVTIHF